MKKAGSKINVFCRILGLCLTVGLLQPAYAQDAIGTVTLKYEVRMNNIALGEAVHRVQIGKSNYSITDLEKATGIVGLFTNAITRKSQGTIVNQQFRTTVYSEMAKNKTRTAKLDWATKTARFSVDPDKVDSFNDTTVDRVSFVYQYYLARKAPPSGTFTQMVADVKRVEAQQFRTIGKETIETPMGRIETIRMERAGDSKNMKLWVSPAHNYLPVRIMYIDKKNNVFDQLITEIN